LTEDRQDGCLYRFVPDKREEPHGKGRLQALAVTKGPAFELAKAVPPDSTFDVKWIDVPPEAGEKDDSLRRVAHQLGAAVVRRGEGICRVSDGLVFTSTEGGPQEIGQIFHLAYTKDGGTLRILAQADEHSALDMPDNITVSPFGDLLVCEDNMRNPHLRVVTHAGAVLPFARNAMSRSEFAGACFSPDGRFLFVNIQEDGLTLAIHGPFEKLSKQT
jgi:secreted PhoX family phosphatase